GVWTLRQRRLCWGEFQPAFRQELTDDGKDFLFQQLTRAAGDDEVVGIADQMDLAPPLLGPRGGEARTQPLVESIEGQVRQDGRDDPALRCAFRGGVPDAFFQEPSLKPLP